MRHENIVGRASSTAQAPFDFTGEWVNELSSTMDIVEEQGVLIGAYTSAVSSDGFSISGQLSGQAKGDLIAFTVKWQSEAITAWVERRIQEAGIDAIETLWQMTSMSDEGATGFWHSINAGADRFQRSAKNMANITQPDEMDPTDAAVHSATLRILA